MLRIKHTLVNQPRWRPGVLVKNRLGLVLQSWLLNEDSLTARLKNLFAGDFKVEIVSQRWGKALVDEAIAMAISPKERVLIREVILHGGGQACVYARSILPQSSLTGRMRSLRKLDNKPLGAWLFSQKNMRRSQLDVADFQQADMALPVPARCNQPLWGRRSVFYIDGKPLLVSEIFLEPLLVAINQKLILG